MRDQEMSLKGFTMKGDDKEFSLWTLEKTTYWREGKKLEAYLWSK